MALTVTLLDTGDSPGDGGCVLDASTASEGDLLIAQVTHDGAVPSTPSGWTLRNTELGSFGHNISTYTKYAAATETSYTFTHGGWSGGVLVGVNGSTGTPTYDSLASNDSAGNAQTVFAATGVAMSAAGVIVTTWMQIDSTATITKPASMTSLHSGVVFRPQATAYESVASGATGTRSATSTNNATWIGVTVGVVESSGPEEHEGSGLSCDVVLTPGQGDGSPQLSSDGTAVELILTPGPGEGSGDQSEDHSGSGVAVSLTLTPGAGVGSPAITADANSSPLGLVPGPGDGSMAVAADGVDCTLQLAAGSGVGGLGLASDGVEVVLILEAMTGAGYVGSYVYQSTRGLLAIPEARTLIALED